MTRPLTPLPVDPEVMARIRPMERAHLPEVARLHSAMGTSLWASLGLPFVESVYRAFLGHPDFIAYVYIDEQGGVGGFIAGTAHGPRMSRGVLLRHGPRLVLATARGLLRHPSAALPMAESLLYFGRSARRGAEEVHAESLFCSFAPGLRGKRVSGLINKVLFDELARRGNRHVKITTEADNALAARQLTSWGFEDLGRFRFYGKEMITWRLDLGACPRVDPSSAPPGSPGASR